MNLIYENWTEDKYKEFICFLKNQSDSKYSEFHSKLIKNSTEIIGIRVPTLRKIAKEISKGNYKSFFKYSSSKYYEEIMIEGLIIGELKLDYDELIIIIDNFINKIDNWAICDSFCSSLKIIKKYKKQFWIYLNNCLKCDNPWKIRFAIVIMLGKYLDDEYLYLVLNRCDNIKNEQYYVKIANAWLIATSYSKFPEYTYKYLLSCSLDKWTYNKAIQKACESYRIDKYEKEKLRNMKRK